MSDQLRIVKLESDMRTLLASMKEMQSQLVQQRAVTQVLSISEIPGQSRLEDSPEDSPITIPSSDSFHRAQNA